MSKKDKVKVVFLTIFTLGFCWLYWYLKNKKRQKVLQQGESVKLTGNIKIDQLIELLGGKENITNVEGGISKVKVEFNDKSKVKVDELRKTSYISGIMVSTKQISLIIGEYSKAVAKELIKVREA